MMSFSQLIALMEKTLEILESSTLWRQLKRFQMMMMIRTSMKTEAFLRLKMLCLTLTMTWPSMTRNTTKHSLEDREARDLMKQARVARGLYSVVVSIRSDKPTSRGQGESSDGKNVLSGKTGRGNGGRGSKGCGRSPNSRGRIKKERGRGRPGPARDGSSSSQVGFKCGSADHWARDCPKMDDGSSKEAKSWILRLWCVDPQYS